MADNEILGILRNATNDGVTPLAVIQGGSNAQTEPGMPAYVAADASGNHVKLQSRTESDSVASTSLSAMVAKTPSGDERKLIVDPSSGALLVTSEGARVKYTNRNFITVAASAAQEDFFDIPLGAIGTVYNLMEWHFAGERDLELEFFYVDDAGGTPVETKQFQVNKESDSDANGSIECFKLNTTGGTGDQVLRIKIKQKQGTPVESFGYVCIQAD
jgi:hypothetical protein